MTKNNDTHTSKFKLTKNQTIAAVVGGIAILGTAVAVPAIADSQVFQHAQLAMSDDGGARVHKAGWSGHKRQGFSEMSEADIEKRVTKMVRHLSIEIDANADQEKLITEVALATAKELKPVRDEFHAAGEKMADLLTAATVDRAAIEALRAERLVATDEVSKTVINAVAQVSEILTPQQREGLAERLDQLKSMRGH